MNKKHYVDVHEENKHSLWNFGGLSKNEKRKQQSETVFKFSL